MDNRGILHDHVSSMTCHSYSNIRCATRNAWALHCWLQYHFRTNSYIECPPDTLRSFPLVFLSLIPSRDLACFSSGILTPVIDNHGILHDHVSSSG